MERLVAADHEVRTLDNFSTGRRTNLLPFADDVEIIEGDIQSYERVHAAVRGCEVVFHQAALPSVPRSIQDPLTSNGVNVVGTLNLLLAARDAGVRRLVFASSSSVYGSNTALPKTEDMPTAPISPYATAKLAAENYCRSFTSVYGLETVSLRYFNVFGARQDPLSQYSAVIPLFIKAALEGSSPTIFGDGQQSRDFTFIENVVTANMLAADVPAVGGRVFNIACGVRTSLNELASKIGDAFGQSAPVRYAEARPGDVRDSLADISRAEADLGYLPSVDLDDGLRRTVEHYRNVVATGIL